MVDDDVILVEHLPEKLILSSAAVSDQLLIPEGGVELEPELDSHRAGLPAGGYPASRKQTGGGSVTAHSHSEDEVPVPEARNLKVPGRSWVKN